MPLLPMVALDGGGVALLHARVTVLPVTRHTHTLWLPHPAVWYPAVCPLCSSVCEAVLHVVRQRGGPG